LAADTRLAARLNTLFAKVHPADRGPYSNEEVAQTIRSQGGEISRAYIAYLRSGERTNPTMQHLAALAGFFGVKPSYFIDDDEADQITAELDLLLAMRDSGVRAVALRASGLSPKGLQAVVDIIERVRDLEWLPVESERDDMKDISPDR
jgi:transcriptional regulator with XRE-family HTH domain